jgi:inosose dehydratase
MPVKAFGVDLITFFHPGFWGVETEDDIQRIGRTDPDRIWATVLDALVAAGVSAVEVTFAPADVETAIRAFGSVGAFRDELTRRGVALVSGFWQPTDWAAPAEQLADEAAAHAALLADAGATALVLGLPMRATTDATSPRFVDLWAADQLADRVHHIGAATRRLGVVTALHTEAHSVFCQPRDIDLLLLLTDPNYVSFCPDSAHITLSGGDPVAVATRHRERIAIAHWKDAAGPMSTDVVIDASIHERHREFMRPLGAGTVDWAAWAEVMATTRGGDLALLELDACADPVAELRSAIAHLGALGVA